MKTASAFLVVATAVTLLLVGNRLEAATAAQDSTAIRPFKFHASQQDNAEVD